MSAKESGASAARRKVGDAQTKYVLRAALIAAIMAGALMFHVSSHGNAIRLGYQLSAAQKKNRDLLRDNDELKVRRASLSAANRLETIARDQLGLVQPTSNQVITIHADGRPGDAPLGAVQRIESASAPPSATISAGKGER